MSQPRPTDDAKLSDPFFLPPALWPEEGEVTRQIAESILACGAKAPSSCETAAEIESASPEDLAVALATIATNAWKARQKMWDAASGEVREEMKRVFRHIEAIQESLHSLGLETKDHTGDTFDYGLPLKVVTTQPMSGLTKETVTETIKPTIYWREQIIQMGEVVIATPASPTTNA